MVLGTKSDLMKFIERYKDITMPFPKLKKIWDKLPIGDFGDKETKQETFEWFQEYRKTCIAQKCGKRAL